MINSFHTIDLDTVVKLHDDRIENYGGLSGLRDRGTLEGALVSCFAIFDGIEFYPSTKEKIAKIVVSLVRLHPFVDGNKRTALAVLIVLSDLNGLNLKTFDYTDLMNGIATKKYDEKDVQRLLS